MSSRFFATVLALVTLSALTSACTAQTEETSGAAITPSSGPVETQAGCNSGSVGQVSYFGTCTSGSGSCFGVRSNGTTCSGADFQCTQSATAPGGYRWERVGTIVGVFMPDNSDQVCAID